MEYKAVDKILEAEKIEAAEGEAAEYITIQMTFVCPKGFQPHDVAEIQSPGPIESLGTYAQNAIFDPWVEEIKVTKRKPVPAQTLNKILHGEHKESGGPEMPKR